MSQEFVQFDLNEEDIEIQLFLEAIYLKYGYDFRNYSKAYIKRRILKRLSLSGLKSISQMQSLVLKDRSFLSDIISDISINVTEMFRDPWFFQTLRKEIIPILKTYPHIKIWHAGCSSGEEVYSMAILLKEEGIYDKSLIYATDFNNFILKKASDAIYPIESIKEYSQNYIEAGGISSLSDYYIAKYDSVIFDKALKKNIVFAEHNIATDSVFGDMNLVICRNVLIYFDRTLQNKAIKLFYDSLHNGCFLCLGPKETINFSDYSGKFDTLFLKERIYKKKYE